MQAGLKSWSPWAFRYCRYRIAQREVCCELHVAGPTCTGVSALTRARADSSSAVRATIYMLKKKRTCEKVNLATTGSMTGSITADSRLAALSLLVTPSERQIVCQYYRMRARSCWSKTTGQPSAYFIRLLRCAVFLLPNKHWRSPLSSLPPPQPPCPLPSPSVHAPPFHHL